MNRTQKQFLGWGLIALGAVMLFGAIYDAMQWASGNLDHLLIHPLLYIGLLTGVVGVVVLKGGKSSR
jgi:deoxyribodipyrimidine photolyase-like uncharacterized protein